jgi:hypothetical protein
MAKKTRKFITQTSKVYHLSILRLYAKIIMEIEIISTAIIAGLILYNLKISREHCTAIHHIENHLGLKDGRKVKK